MTAIVTLAVGLSRPPQLQAQGTTYVSNLGATPSGSLAIGSDSWAAAWFTSGATSGGYRLDSIQLGMADASGAPTGFGVMLYNSGIGIAPIPGTSLGTLSGSPSPSTAGVYIFTPPVDLVLSKQTSYFIVLTGGTPIAGGAYQWDRADTSSYDLNGGWGTTIACHSANGSSWSYVSAVSPVFAINATPEPAVPEPNTAAVVALGLLALGLRKCRTHA